MQVDSFDLTNATHEQAVEAIRRAGSKVTFVVQSFVGQDKVSRPFFCMEVYFDLWYQPVGVWLSVQ